MHGNEPNNGQQDRKTDCLRVVDLSASYGMVRVLWDVSLTVGTGELVGLIGSNGAGKTTILRTISGLVKPQSGEISLHGDDITGRRTDEIVRKGIAHVPEGRRLFGNLSVEENLLMGAYTRESKETKEQLEFVESLFPRLAERRTQLAATLSGGEQQMVAIGRALMSKPQLLLLDEPSLGIMPIMVTALFETIEEIREHTTILLVEQNVSLTLSITDRCYVLENGRMLLDGTAAELRENDYVLQAYLGEGVES